MRAVAFDLMGTVLYDPYREALAAATGGMGLAELRERRGEGLHARLERGEISEDSYWQRHREAGIPADPEAFHAARRRGYRWLPGMRRLVGDVRGCCRTVAATNYPVWIRELRMGLLAGHFDGVYASCELGVRKPDAGFYRALLERLELPASRVVFVDDRPENVRGARRVGLCGIPTAPAPRLRARLREAGVPV